jgi:hypothetical protein
MIRKALTALDMAADLYCLDRIFDRIEAWKIWEMQQ